MPARRPVSIPVAADTSELIRGRFDGLSTQHKRVAEFILNQPGRAAVLSATRIGEELGISPSTVVRIARALDFDGFPDLQANIQRQVFGEVDTLRRLDETVEDQRAGPIGVLDQVLRADIEHLQETLTRISPAAFERAVTLLTSATAVFVLGRFVSVAPAHILAMGLRLCGIDARMVGDARTDLADELLAAGPGMVVVAFSVARYPMTTVVGLEEGRAAGASTIAITDRPTSPLGTRADVVLVAGSGPLPFFQSLTAAVSVANALVTAVSVTTPERSAAALERAEHVWDRRRTFYQEQHSDPPRS